MTSGQQTFYSAYPLDIKIQNRFQGEDLPVLYIVDKVDRNDKAQQIRMSIQHTDKQNYVFKGFSFKPPSSPVQPEPSASTTLAPSNSVFIPGADQFNLAVILKQGVLRADVKSSFTSELQSAFSEALGASNACVVSGPVTRNSDGALIWYCAFQNDILLDSSNGTGALNVTVRGISAEAGVGSRGAQAEFQFGNILLNNTGNPLTFTRTRHLDIVNHRGSTYAPIFFAVNGKNIVWNRNDYQNTLKVYFETIGKEPVEFDENTRIIFSFPYGDGPACFASNSLAAGNDCKPVTNGFVPDKKEDISYDKNKSFGLIAFSVKYTQQEKLNWAEFLFNPLYISGEDGIVPIQIKIENLPGYWDTDFQLPVIKETSILNGESLLLGKEIKDEKTDKRSRIDFYSGGTNDTDGANVFIEENKGLNFYGTKDQPVKIQNADLLIQKNRLAVNAGEENDFPDQSKLYVEGDSHFNGKVQVNKDAEISGNLLIGNQLTGSDRFLKIMTAGGNHYISGIQLYHFEGDYGFSFENNERLNILNIRRVSDYKPVGIFDETCLSIDFLSGKIGIGTTTPAEKLEVDGNVKSKERLLDKTGPVMPVGSILAYAGNAAPEGWLLCNGNPIPSQYGDLINLIGANTPNLCGRTLLGAGQLPGGGNYTKGQTGGQEQHTLSTEEMPAHSHYSFGEADGRWDFGVGNRPHMGSKGGIDYDNYYYNTSSTGSNRPHNNMQPYYVVNYIIKC